MRSLLLIASLLALPLASLAQTAPPDFVPVDTQPETIHQVAPEYPDSARVAGLEGRVMLRLWIDTAGKVREVQLFQTDHPIFVAPSIKAVRQWRFRPAMKDGAPVAVWMMLPIRFRQRQEAPLPAAPRPGTALPSLMQGPPAGFTPFAPVDLPVGADLRAFRSAGPGGMLMVLESTTAESNLPDTSLAYRRGLLAEVGNALLTGPGFTRPGAPVERVATGHLALRFAGTAQQPGEATAYLTGMVALPRTGDVRVVTALYYAATPADRDAPAMARYLDSLRLRPAPVDSSALARLNGTWRWTEGTSGTEPTVREAFTLTVAPGGQTIHLAYTADTVPPGGDAKRRHRYEVLGLTSTAVRARLVREDGPSPVWDFVWRPDGTFCWHEATWPADACTIPVAREATIEGAGR